MLQARFRFFTLSGVIWVALEYFCAFWLPPKASQTSPWLAAIIIMLSCALAPKGDRYSAAATPAPARAKARALVFIFNLVDFHAAIGGVADHVHQPADQG